MKILKINVIFLLIACLLFAFVSCDVDYDSSRKGNLESSTSNPKSADKSEAIKNLFSPGKKVKVKGGKKLTGLSGGETEIEALIGENILTVEQIETKNTNYVNNTIGFRYLLQNIFTGKKSEVSPLLTYGKEGVESFSYVTIGNCFYKFCDLSMGEDSKNDVSGSTFLKLNADDSTITMLEKLHGLHGSMNLFNSENKVNPIVDVFGIDAAHIGYLYSEYMPDGSVYSYIKSYNLSTHKSNIVLKLHFDISVKSSNILCASSYGGKIYAVVDEYTPDKNGNKSGRYTCNISVFDVKGNLLEKYSFPSQIESKFGTEENDYPYSLAVFGNYMMISMYSMGDMYVLKMSDSKLTLFACDDSGYYRRRLATENGNSFKKPLNDKYVLIGDADKLTVLDIEKGELVEVSFDCGGKSYDELGFTADENYNIIVTARNNIETNDNSKSNADYYYFTCDELLEALRNI